MCRKTFAVCILYLTSDMDAVLTSLIHRFLSSSSFSSSHLPHRVSAYKLRDSLAKHALRFFGTGGTANLLGRIKWATQLKPRPPTFVLLLRGSEEVDEGGQRFLANVLRQSLGMQGVPLRLYLR